MNWLFQILLTVARLMFPQLASRENQLLKYFESVKTTHSFDLVEVRNCPSFKNGQIIPWSLDDKPEMEEVFVVCDCDMSWTSDPIVLFKDYWYYRRYKESLPDDQRFLLAAQFSILSMTDRYKKIGAYCPFCQKHIEVTFDIRPEKG